MVLWSTLLLSATMATLAGEQAERPQRPLKVFISADMEGVTGVVQPAQLGPAGFEYERARQFLTREINAVIDAARAAGATEFVVADAHGNGQNLLIDQFPDDVGVVRGSPRPLQMMQGVDETFAAAFLVGYHSDESVVGAVRGHIFSSSRLIAVKLNGTPVSEGVFNAAVAGEFGVPVALVSGDAAAVEQFHASVPTAEGVIVKRAFGYHSALTVTPARGAAMIREATTRAMNRLTTLRPFRIPGPVELEVVFRQILDAERIAFIPGVTRVDAHTVRGRFADLLEISRLMQVMYSLVEPPS